MKLTGVYVALVTPFDRVAKIDTTAYAKHLDFLSEAKVHGFVPCGTTGEGPTLDHDERSFLIGEAVSVASRYNLKVIAGCGSNDPARVLHYSEVAAKLGANAALVVTPYYNRPTQSGVIAHYHFIADRSPIPVVLYHVPQRTAVFLELKTTLELLAHPNIIGIKEASPNYSHWMGLASNMDANGRSLLAGDDDAFSAILSLGGTGIISATANLCPHIFVKIFELFRSNRTADAYRLQRQLYPVIHAMFCETNPGPLKHALSLMERMGEFVRLPLVPPSPPSQGLILEALEVLKRVG